MIDINQDTALGISWGAYGDSVREWIETAEKNQFIKRLWAKDPSLWKKDPAAQKEISARLGWLDAPASMMSAVDEITAFAESIRAKGFTHVLLLGMGGSSLAPEFFQGAFGNKEGHPRLVVLDSTDPGRIADIEGQIELKKTLFIVSSKSGGTIELISLFKYFYEKVKDKKGDKAGEQFVAITDPRSPLEEVASQLKFAKIFRGFEDVGGRFSALTCFGLVPAALIGVDIRRLLDAVETRVGRAAREESVSNPFLQLGVGMAVLAESGRDKLTLVTSAGLELFADWIEQLVAESSGKDESGIVPVVREPLGETGVYGEDRFFVAILSESADNTDLEARLRQLEKKGHPVVTIRLSDLYDLGAEFFRWEGATAIACALLKVNAFDQPDVQAAKDKAKQLLKRVERGERVALPAPDQSLEFFWENVNDNDYIGILAFLPDREALRKKLVGLQQALRDKTRKAVTLGIGPRYLHSTGQLHKGGANNGDFLLLAASPAQDIEIPAEKFTFGQLELAQAVGDLEALQLKGRNVYVCRLEGNLEKALEDASDQIRAALNKVG